MWFSSDYVKNNPSVSTALAKTEDFSHYERLGIVTLPGSQDKDVVLFPRDVAESEFQRYMLLHRPSAWVGPQYNTEKPSIWIAEGDSVTNYDKHSLLLKPEETWEALKIGVGVPPIKTEKGWLVIYHGVRMRITFTVLVQSYLILRNQLKYWVELGPLYYLQKNSTS